GESRLRAPTSPLARDLVIVGAGPERILILQKGPAHSSAIRKFYPADKRVDAVYKGIPHLRGSHHHPGRHEAADARFPGPEHPTFGAERPRPRWRWCPLVYALGGSTPRRTPSSSPTTGRRSAAGRSSPEWRRSRARSRMPSA